MTAQHENRWEQYQTRHAIPITHREKYFEHNINPNSNKNIQKKENEIEKAKPIPFLDDLDKKWGTNEGWKWIHEVFGKEIVEKEDE